MKSNVILMSLFGSMLLLTLLASGCERPDPPPAAIRPIDWVTVRIEAARSERSLPGRVKATDQSTLSFERAGRIDALAVDVGTRFKKGDVLARLRPTDAQLALRRAQANLRMSQASAKEANQQHARMQKLLQQGAATPSDFDQSLARRDTAQAQVDVARASVATQREELSKLVLRAPYDGSVTARHAEPSEQVAPGRRILEIQRSSSGLEVKASLPENLVGAVRVDQELVVRLPAQAEASLRGTVVDIGARADDGGNFPIRVRLDDAPDDVRPGMSAELWFASKAKDAEVSIPLTAFRAGPGSEQLAYVYDPETQTLKQTAIDIDRIEDERAWVRSGLEPGEIIAARGVSFLRDGQQVRLLGQGTQRFDAELTRAQ